MVDITIRNLTYDDLPDLERLFSEPAKGAHKRRLKKQSQGKHSYYGIFTDGELIGISLIRWTGPVSKVGRLLSSYPEVGSTYVLPTHRGKGLFSRLYDHIESEVYARGYSGIGAVIRDANGHSITVHQKRGYEPIGIIEPHQNDPDTQRHYYVKRLSRDQ